jgi:hypothetical protein
VGDMMEDEVGDKGAHKLGDKDIRRQSRGYKGIKKRRTKSETIGGQSGAKRGANRRTRGDTHWNGRRHRSPRQVGKQGEDKVRDKAGDTAETMWETSWKA